MRFLIYGDSQDQEMLRPLLRQCKPLQKLEIEYCYQSAHNKFLNELRHQKYDLFIVTANGEAGRSAIQIAKLYAPDTPRLWISDIVDYVFESYELECVWFIKKPLQEERLEQAMPRFIYPNRYCYTQDSIESILSGGEDYESE